MRKWTTLKQNYVKLLGIFLVICTVNNGIVNHFNSPFPSSFKPLFQSEAKCKPIGLKRIYNFHAHKTHFLNKGFALTVTSFWKWQFWNSERDIVINTGLKFRVGGTCDITGTLKMHICKWSGPAKTPCYILGRSDIPEFCWRMWTQVFECVKTSKTLACNFFFCVRITHKAKPTWAA